MKHDNSVNLETMARDISKNICLAKPTKLFVSKPYVASDVFNIIRFFLTKSLVDLVE